MGSDLPSAALPPRATTPAAGMTRRLRNPASHALGLAGGAVIRVAQRGSSAPLALARRRLAGPVRLAGRHLTVVTAVGAAGQMPFMEKPKAFMVSFARRSCQ